MKLAASGGIALALTVVASFTTAFSTGAEVVTGVAIGLFVSAGVVAARRRSRRRSAGRPVTPTAGGIVTETSAGPLTIGFVAWATLAAIALSFELWNYFLSPRPAHPTVSYFLAGAAGEPWSRGILFLLWLALGAYLTRP
jgi:hypothetical protein